MDRRNFLSLGLLLAPVAAISPALALPAQSMSRTASKGFLPNVPLITQNGENVKFYEDLVRNKTVLINFFVIACGEGRCPIAMANLRKVQDKLGNRMGRDIFFLSVTLRPELERPKGLKAYADTLEAKPGWTFLTGEAKEVETLRRALGYVDSDPERDKDLSNHIGMGRYGDDKLDRWGSVSLRSPSTTIASTFEWLSK